MSVGDTVRVVVAPGETVTIAPHPSGIAQLPPLTLHGGGAVRVTPARAEALWRAGKVLDPVTGQARPAPVQTAPVPLVQRTGESWQDAARRAQGEQAKASTPRPRPQVLDPWNGRHHYEPHDPRTTPQRIDLTGDPRVVDA